MGAEIETTDPVRVVTKAGPTPNWRTRSDLVFSLAGCSAPSDRREPILINFYKLHGRLRCNSC